MRYIFFENQIRDSLGDSGRGAFFAGLFVVLFAVTIFVVPAILAYMVAIATLWIGMFLLMMAYQFRKLRKNSEISRTYVFR